MATLKGFGSLAAIPAEKMTDKITRRIVAGEKSMAVWVDIKAGAHAAAHSHPHEQIVWMIKGKMDFRIGSDRRVLKAGDVAGA
jgi:quercetin dioxygenase-like cupin family protein